MTTHSLPPEVLAELHATRAEARREGEAQTKVPVDRVEDVDAGGVPARLYVPAGATDALLYLHGGGFALGDLVTHDGFARRLADRTGWAVLLVDYRRSPEHAWPAAVDDAATASDWFAGQGFGRLVVAGDSAGSALAIAEALRVPDRWVGQVQVYPFVDPSGGSYDTTLVEPDLPIERCQMFWDAYLQGAAGDEALHVLERDSLAGQPPTLVQLAETDVLTTTGRQYAAALARDDVPVRVEVYPGVQHGFWRRPEVEQSARALDDVADWLSTL